MMILVVLYRMACESQTTHLQRCPPVRGIYRGTPERTTEVAVEITSAGEK
jgi:hypothetical protein